METESTQEEISIKKLKGGMTHEYLPWEAYYYTPVEDKFKDDHKREGKRGSIMFGIGLQPSPCCSRRFPI
jgi:hypothetical protein